MRGKERALGSTDLVNTFLTLSSQCTLYTIGPRRPVVKSLCNAIYTSIFQTLMGKISDLVFSLQPLEKGPEYALEIAPPKYSAVIEMF